MLSTDITLAGDASSSTTYSLVSIADFSSVRADSASAPGQPKQLLVKSTQEKQGQIRVNRHLVRLDRTKTDAEGRSVTGSVYCNIVNPLEIMTTAEISDMVTQLKNFLTSGNLTKVLNREP